MIRPLGLAVLGVLLMPVAAHADIVLTRTGDTYTVSDAGGVTDVTTVTVSHETVVAPRVRRAPAGQTYTFTTQDLSFAATVPIACKRSADTHKVTCADTEGVDADVDSLVMQGNGGGDTLRVVYVSSPGLSVGLDNVTIDGGAGFDTLQGAASDDTLIAGEDGASDVLIGGGGADHLVCGDTSDVISYNDGRTTGVHATLTPLGAPPGPDGDTITGPCEGIIGTAKADVLEGNGGQNTLNGLGGDDVLRGGIGSDVIVGDAGADTIDCDDEGRTSGVSVDLTTGAGCDPGESVNTVENVTGSRLSDMISVGAGDNRVSGLPGDDFIHSAGTTSDTLDGGSGADTVEDLGGGGDVLAFTEGRGTGVTVDLATDPGDDGDVIVGTFEVLEGSPFADVLTGDAHENAIEGGAGDDILRGGLGRDSFDGGAGEDELRFDEAERTTGVTATLSDLAVLIGADPERLEPSIGVEDLVGSRFDDELSGSGGPNRIDGGPGKDTIEAMAGDDTLLVHDGAIDTVDCGDGVDAAKRDLSDALTACEALDPADAPPTASSTPSVTAAPTTSPTSTPTPAPTAVPGATPKLSSRFKVRARSTTIKRLTVTGLPAGGGAVKVACKAPKGKKRSCAFKARTAERTSAGSITLKGLFKGRKLAPGTKITLTVTGTGVKTTTIRLRIRKGKTPARS